MINEKTGCKSRRAFLRAKTYLHAYRSLVLCRDGLLEELAALKKADALVGGLSSGRQQTPKSTKGRQALARVLDPVEEALAVRLVLIERLPDEHQKMILTYRYIRCYSWADIGRRVGLAN